MKKKKNVLFLIIGLLIIASLSIWFIFFKNEKDNKVADNYTIPKVYFEGNIAEMYTKEDERTIKLKYTDGKQEFESYASIKIQGTSSIGYDKKNYTIKLFKDEELSEKNPVDVGWGEQNKYCLKANWIDKTHARNIVSAKIMAQIQSKYDLLENTPNNGVIDGFPIEIYINDEFLGLYTWNIPKDEWMFNMDSENENHIVFASEDWLDGNVFKGEASYDTWSIEVGRGDDKDLEKLNKLIDFVNNSSDKEFKQNFEKHLNFDATINYFIMMQFAELWDNVAKNQLLVTYDGKIWYPVLYDLDTSWGTDYNGKDLYDYTALKLPYFNKLYIRVATLFSEEIEERYFELRKDILTKENVMKEFNDFKALIPDSTFELENNRWNVNYTIPGYDYSQIEDFLDTRISIVDKHMKELEKSSY